MSSINGVGGTSPLQPTPTNNKTAAAEPTQKQSISDRLELSGASHLLAALKTNDVRTEKVADIRAQIANGTYDADGSKLDGSLGKLLDELQK